MPSINDNLITDNKYYPLNYSHKVAIQILKSYEDKTFFLDNARLYHEYVRITGKTEDMFPSITKLRKELYSFDGENISTAVAADEFIANINDIIRSVNLEEPVRTEIYELFADFQSKLLESCKRIEVLSKKKNINSNNADKIENIIRYQVGLNKNNFLQFKQGIYDCYNKLLSKDLIDNYLSQNSSIKIIDPDTMAFLLLRYGISAYNFASDELKDDMVINYLALFECKNCPEKFKMFPDKFQKELDFIIAGIRLIDNLYDYIPEEFKANPDVLFSAGIFQNGVGLKTVYERCPELLSDKEFVKNAVSYFSILSSSDYVTYIDKDLQENEEVACSANDRGIELDNFGKLQYDKGFVKKIIEQNPENALLVKPEVYNDDEELKKNIEMIREVMSVNKQKLEQFSNEYLNHNPSAIIRPLSEKLPCVLSVRNDEKSEYFIVNYKNIDEKLAMFETIDNFSDEQKRNY